jgi:response regulator RpfG family c-di-GMP phosphodiesterase
MEKGAARPLIHDKDALRILARHSFDEAAFLLQDHAVTSYLLRNAPALGRCDPNRLKRTALLSRLLAEAAGCSKAVSKQIERAVLLFDRSISWCYDADGLPTLEMAKCLHEEHLERWDGTSGFRCLQGEQIALATRIFQVCEAFITLISGDNRLQQGTVSTFVEAYDSLRQEAGTRFDPNLVSLLLENVLGDFAPRQADQKVA